MKVNNLIFPCLLCVIVVACGQTAPTPTQITYPEAMIAFRVTLPAPPNPGEAVMLTIVDEITGLAFNTQNYPLEAEDPQHYKVILPFRVGSVIRYHYTRHNGIILQEHLSDGRLVRYRMMRVDGPSVVNDVVSRWTDTPFTWPSGRIAGKITDSSTGKPVPSLLVNAGGAQAITTSDGSYLIEGLPPGVHNLVAYAIDGTYQTYQQGASVAEDSLTPASFAITPTIMVNVTFTVTVPVNTPPDAPLRFAGNLVQLGNSFADLTGGGSSLASRMPPLIQLPDGRYTITLSLPAGADIKYKYTLGDGYWSCERNLDGSFRIRTMIVPEKDTTLEDTVDTWLEGGYEPITLNLKVPGTTPVGEGVSIQLNPGYSWTEPIPMWKVGENLWKFVLTGPQDGLNTITYRYCREGQCGSADDVQTKGENQNTYLIDRMIHPGERLSIITDTVQAWVWVTSSDPAVVPNVIIQPRDTDFIAGIEFQPEYRPNWGALWSKTIIDVQQSNANWLIFTPSWSFTRLAPPVLELQPGNDIFWAEQAYVILQARDNGLAIALFPTPNFPIDSSLWWEAAPRDFSWWVSWFDHYQDYLLHYADMAQRTGVRMLILGGDWLSPALPGGTLVDGTYSNVPVDAEKRWRDIIKNIRSRFDGTILWSIPYQPGSIPALPFIDAVDGIYLLWSASLSGVSDPSLEAAKLLDSDIFPLHLNSRKPVLIGLSYASAAGAISGCIKNADGACIEPSQLSRPNEDIPGVEINSVEQADAFNAILLAINDRLWIAGVVARGYYPPIALQDKSTSIRGKLAGEVIRYWYPKFLGK